MPGAATAALPLPRRPAHDELRGGVPLGATVARRRPALRVVPSPPPAPRMSRGRRGDVAFALALAALLLTGVLGVLALNTSMQQQADRMAAQHRVLDRLSLQQQNLQLTLDRLADPALLASRAAALHMRPVGTSTRWLDARR